MKPVSFVARFRVVNFLEAVNYDNIGYVSYLAFWAWCCNSLMV